MVRCGVLRASAIVVTLWLPVFFSYSPPLVFYFCPASVLLWLLKQVVFFAFFPLHLYVLLLLTYM